MIFETQQGVQGGSLVIRGESVCIPMTLARRVLSGTSGSSEWKQRTEENPSSMLRSPLATPHNSMPAGLISQPLWATKPSISGDRKSGDRVGVALTSCSESSAVEPHFSFWGTRGRWNFLLLSCWPATGPKLVKFNYNKHTANELYLTVTATSRFVSRWNNFSSCYHTSPN